MANVRSRYIWALLFILIISGFFRLYHLTTAPPGLYPDEAMDGNSAVQALHSGFKVFYPENNGREGLFVNVEAVFIKLLGVTEPWVLRLPSAIFGIFTVIGIYFLCRELFFSEETALLSAFFMATGFWHIVFSRIGFRAIAAPFFLVLSLYFLLRSLHLKKFADGRFKIAVFSLIGGVLFGLGFYTYIAYRVTPALILLILAFYWLKLKMENQRKQFYLSAVFFLLAAFFTALPIGLYFLHHPGDFFARTSEISIFSSKTPLWDLGFNILKTLGMFNFQGDFNWRQNYSGRPELFWPVGVLFVIGVALGLRSLFRRSDGDAPLKLVGIKREEEAGDQGFGGYLWEKVRFPSLVLFLWFFLAMLPVVFSDEGIPHALRSILLAPPVYILAGVGGVEFYNFLRKYIHSFWLPLASAIFLFILVFEAYNTYFNLWNKDPNTAGAFNSNYVAIGRELNSLPRAVQKYVVVEAGGVLVNGIPMPAQTVMFITNTYLPEDQAAKNIHYIPPGLESGIPAGAVKFYVR